MPSCRNYGLSRLLAAPPTSACDGFGVPVRRRLGTWLTQKRGFVENPLTASNPLPARRWSAIRPRAFIDRGPLVTRPLQARTIFSAPMLPLPPDDL